MNNHSPQNTPEPVVGSQTEWTERERIFQNRLDRAMEFSV